MAQRMVTGSVLQWTRDSVKKAAREFELPRDTKTIIFWPDLLQRQTLQKDPNYATETGGVLTPCPACCSNKFVDDRMIWTCSQRQKLRTIVGADGIRYFIMAPIHSCANPECVGIRNLEKPGDTLDDAAKCTAHTFILFQPESWKNYPTSVRNQYGWYLWQKEDKEATNEESVCEDLCSLVLNDRTLFSQLATKLAENYDRYKARAIRDYVTFQTSETGSQNKSIWPDFAVLTASGK
jgi:hypothetical protein